MYSIDDAIDNYLDSMDDQDLIDMLIDRGYTVYDENGDLCERYKSPQQLKQEALDRKYDEEEQKYKDGYYD